MNMRSLFIKIYKNGQLIEVKQFHAERIVLGSGDVNVDIRLEGLLPSSHAVIQKESDGLYHVVILAGVEPGIFVSGQQVWRYPLVSYGVFQLGYYHIEFWEMLSQRVSVPPHPPVVAHPISNPFDEDQKTQVTTTQTVSSPIDPLIQTQQDSPFHPSYSEIPTQSGPVPPPQSPQFPSHPEIPTQSGPVPPPQSPQFPSHPEIPTQSGPVPPPQSPQFPSHPEIPTQSGPVPPPQSPQFPSHPEIPTQSGPVPPPQSPQFPSHPEIPTQSGPVPPPQSPQFPSHPEIPTQSGPVPPPQSPQFPSYPEIPTQSGPVPPPQSPQFPSYPEIPTQSGPVPPPQSPQFPSHPEIPTQSGPVPPPQVAEGEPYPEATTEVQQNLLHSIQSDMLRSSAFTLPTEVPVSVLTKPAQQEVKQTFVPKENIVHSSPSQVGVLQIEEEPSGRQEGESYRRKRTFADNSHVKDINERVQPENGSVVKVIVAWNDKILNTLYFDYNSTVKVGSHSKNDIVLPVFSDSKDSHSLIKIKNLASLFVTYEMKGVLVKGSETITFDDMINNGAASRQDTGFTIDLQRGELARVDFDSGISIFVKYTVPSPKPLIGPFFDFTSGELNTIIMAIGGSIIMAIFFLIAHEPEVVKLEDEVERKAIFVYKPPPPPPRIDPIPVKPKPIKVKPRKVKKMAKKPKKPAQRVKTVTRQKQVNNKKTRVAQRRPKKEGKRGGGRKANKSKNRQAVASANANKTKNRSRGGGVAAGRKNKKDVSKSGLLGAFAKGGQQDSLREAFDGAGVVENLAQRAKGRGGGRGGGIGGELAAIGKGGRGESTYGVGGIKTKGRGGGGGVKGAGQGSLGGKLNVRVDVSGGAGESFEGVIDKEAVRRVVKRNVKQLRTCYERLAQKDPNASGRVDLNWTIGKHGRVGSVKVVKSQIKDRSTLDCMKLRLAAWRFPDPPEGVIGDINYPFVFVISRQ